MKSGLEDRNNANLPADGDPTDLLVSMKSGLEDRNNEGHGGGHVLAF